MSLTIGSVWLIECQRCANYEHSFVENAEAACEEFEWLGWRDDFCPACNEGNR